MISVNAWDATYSVWGKLCIVFFYLFIWLQIIWAAELVVLPRYGWECFYEPYEDNEFAMYWITAVLRGMNILTIGFYLYADRGGIKVWNVTMVFLFNLAWSILYLVGLNKSPTLAECPKHCQGTFDSFAICLWVLLAWSFANLLFSVLEKNSAPSGSASETAPLHGKV